VLSLPSVGPAARSMIFTVNESPSGIAAVAAPSMLHRTFAVQSTDSVTGTYARLNNSGTVQTLKINAPQPGLRAFIEAQRHVQMPLAGLGINTSIAPPTDTDYSQQITVALPGSGPIVAPVPAPPSAPSPTAPPI